MAKGKNILTPAQEVYSQERAKGKTQRQAYLVAFPSSHKWKPETVDNRAYELEKRGEVSARIRRLQEIAARKAVVTRVDIINALGETLKKGVSSISSDAPVDAPAVSAVMGASDRLMKWLPPEKKDESLFIRDFALLVAPSFFEAHRLIDKGDETDFWFKGGRGSTKSSFCSLEVIKWIESHPDQHGVVLMKHKANLRDAAYAQVVWAINALDLADDYEIPDSTLRIKKKSTGQLILFRGCDNANKIKSIKVPFGYIGAIWFEESDMFSGMAEIRKVNQSLSRGGKDCVRLYSFNPPRSKSCWVNVEMQNRLDAGQRVFSSTYLDVPVDWLGEQFIADANELKEKDRQSYDHEYLGLPVGNGTEVFDRVVFREITDEEIAAFEFQHLGQDFGWYPDPWALTASEWQPAKHTILTYMELGGNKLQPSEQAERIKHALTWKDFEDDGETYHHIPVYSDDADPTAIAAQRDNDVNARAAHKGNMRMASYRFLQSNTWVIDPVRCPNLAREVREKQYEINADGEVLNSIPDGNDHWIDATRYAFMKEAKDRRSYRP